MKFKYILPLLIITNFAAVAQQVIEFYSLSGSNTLSQEDVNTILENEWIEGEFFIANIDPNITMIYIGVFYKNEYLIKVIGPNVEWIWDAAFYDCLNLVSISFPKVERIDYDVFSWCESLTSIDFPRIEIIGMFSFINCISLTSVSLGTSFTKPITIDICEAVFGFPNDAYIGPILTTNIDLILGNNVLPKPDLEKNIWQGTNVLIPGDTCYIWKSISVIIGIEKEIEVKDIFHIGNNKYMLNNVKQAKLYDLMGSRLIDFSNIEIIDLNNWRSGFYFLQYLTDKNKIRFKTL